MLEDLLNRDPVRRSQPEASPYEILALVSESRSELEVGVADLLVLLEGDVPADHVVEEDAQAPDGSGNAVVAAIANPLWWSVNSGS
jgi:hypothetical protein